MYVCVSVHLYLYYINWKFKPSLNVSSLTWPLEENAHLGTRLAWTMRKFSNLPTCTQLAWTNCFMWFLGMLSLLCLLSCPPLTGPECYVRPHVVTNKKLIRNALIFVCLAGEANITTKQRALAVRQDIPSALYLFLPTLSPSPLRSWTHLGLVTSWYSSVTHSAISSKLSMATIQKMTRWGASDEREGVREGGRKWGQLVVV